MPDYNLSGLSPRAFEQLIQALMIETLGPSTVVFGDGPDGGREATYEGKIHYKKNAEPWDGYLIVQAKFRQRPLGPSADGAWAIDMLRRELSHFLARAGARRPPDYYVFCTNVTLTPAASSGSKDRVFGVLQDAAKKLRIKDFDVWDYDKLRALLDSHADIRRAYAAWITPGDVLSKLLEPFTEKAPDLEQALVGFLEKELLDNQNVNLDQAGHSSEEPVPMSAVFVDLPATSWKTPEPPFETLEPGNRLPPGLVAELITAADSRVSSLTGPGGEEPSSRSSQSRIGRFVVVGGPGQGKTTINQFLCQLYRVALLQTRSQSLLPETGLILERTLSHCTTQGIRLPSAKRFPLFVKLSQFAQYLAAKRSETRTLLDYVTSKLTSRTPYDVSRTQLRSWLMTYSTLLVLDGLDEVPASSNRADVLTAIRDFIVDANQLRADIFIVASTRPQGYNSDFSPQFYRHVYLAPLSAPRALHYGTLLASERFRADSDRHAKVVHRLTEATHESATVRLMRSPLQVTIMATLVDQVGRPPQERYRLFQEYYKTIYHREREKDTPASRILRDHEADIDSIHYSVGIAAQIGSERAGGTDAKLSQGELRDVVGLRLRSEGYPEGQLESLQSDIIEAATERLVFLVGVGEDHIGFEIRSLQEFMAAEALMTGTDDLLGRRLRAIAPISHWRNVFLFAAGRCYSSTDRQHLRYLVDEVCQELDVTHRTLYSAAFTGADLALAVLEDGAARRSPLFERRLIQVACRFMSITKIDVLARLAAVYHEEVFEIYYSELERRLYSPVDIGAWVVLADLVDRNIAWASDLFEARWPRARELHYDILVVMQEYVSHHANSRCAAFLGNWSVDTLHSFRSVGLPRIRPYLQFSNYGTDPLREAVSFVCGRGQRTSFDYVDHGKALLLELLTSKIQVPLLKAAPGDGPFWRAVCLILRFQGAPTRSLLSEVLFAVAELSTAERRFLTRCSMWPLAAVLCACPSSQDVARWAKKAAQGDCGDYREWVAAEERWAGSVTEEDVLAYDEHACEVGPYLSDRGFPLLVAASSMSDVRSEEVGLRLLGLSGVVKERSLGRAIARIAVDMFCSQIDVSRAASVWLLRELASALSVAGPGVGYREVLETVAQEVHVASMTKRPLVELLKVIGNSGDLGGGVRCTDGFAQFLGSEYVRRENAQELLPVLAACIEGGASVAVQCPISVVEGSAEARVLVQMASVEPDCWRLGLATLADLIRRDARFGVRAVRAARTARTDESRLSEVVACVLQHLGDKDWRTPTAIREIVEPIISGHQSPLTSVEGRAKLGFSFD